LFKNNVKASGKNAAGRIMHQIPYPHLQVVVLYIALPMIDPIHTVIRKGVSGILDQSARFSRLLVSAMKICWRICKPVFPAE
jgi:hypothetical protein